MRRTLTKSSTFVKFVIKIVGTANILNFRTTNDGYANLTNVEDFFLSKQSGRAEFIGHTVIPRGTQVRLTSDYVQLDRWGQMEFTWELDPNNLIGFANLNAILHKLFP